MTKLLRLPDVIEIVRLKRSAIYGRCDDGRFPSPVKIGRANLWVSEEIDEYCRRVRQHGEPSPGTYKQGHGRRPPKEGSQ